MSTAKATHIKSGTLLATVDLSSTHKVEGNIYFPASALQIPLPNASGGDAGTHLTESHTHYTCPWKGQSSYYNLVLGNGETVRDVGWYYATPSKKAVESGVDVGSVAWDKGSVRVEVV